MSAYITQFIQPSPATTHSRQLTSPCSSNSVCNNSCMSIYITPFIQLSPAITLVHSTTCTCQSRSSGSSKPGLQLVVNIKLHAIRNRCERGIMRRLRYYIYGDMGRERGKEGNGVQRSLYEGRWIEKEE